MRWYKLIEKFYGGMFEKAESREARGGKKNLSASLKSALFFREMCD